MIDPATAEQLLAHARGPAVDILFAHVTSLESGITTAPSPQVVLARWKELGAEDACDLIAVITDADLLDRIAERERRRRVRRALCANPNLHVATRLYLLQSARRDHDEETASEALELFPAEHIVAMHASDPNLGYSNALVASALARTGDVQSAVAMVREPGGDSILGMLLRFDVVFAIDVADAAGIDCTKIAQRYLGRPQSGRELSIAEMRRVIDVLGDDTGVGCVRTLIGDDFDKMLMVDRRVVARALEWLDVVDADVATFCIDNDFVHSLRFDAVTFTDEAIERLIDAQAWQANPAVLLHHPDKHKVLAMVGENITEVLAGAESSGSAALAGMWLGSMAQAFTPVRFWEVVAQAALRVDRRFVQALSPVVDVPALFNAAPDDTFLRMDVLPDTADLGFLLSRSETMEEPLRQHVLLLILAAAREEETPILEPVVDALVASFSDTALVSWLQARGAARPTRTELDALTRRHPDVVARLCDRPGILGIAVPLTDDVAALMRPSTGWGQVVARDGSQAVLNVLEPLIGDDANLWQVVLSLFDPWVGTLEELVAAARTV